MNKRKWVRFIFLLGVLTIAVYFRMERNWSFTGQLEQRIFIPALQKRSVATTKPNKPKDAISPQSKVKVILILAYMHTGSTFLGSILQRSSGSYYEYESLRSLQQDTRAARDIIYMNGTKRHTHGQYVAVSIATDAVSKMITCRHDLLDVSTLSHHFHPLENDVNRDTAEYYKCIRAVQRREMPVLSHFSKYQPSRFSKVRKPLNVSRIQERFRKFKKQKYLLSPNITHQRLPPMHVAAKQQMEMNDERHMQYFRPIIEKCLPLLTNKCKNASTRAIKFIRMSMEVAEYLLDNYPGIKIIHLTRDPRAMMDSQVRKNDMGSKHFAPFIDNTVSMCTRMQHDLELLHVLNKSYPRSIYSVQYEHFLQAPLGETEKLFEFLDLNYTDDIKHYVASKTVLQEPTSITRIQIWRHHISQQHLNVIDRKCINVYNELGYIKQSSILDIRNLSKPTFL